MWELFASVFLAISCVTATLGQEAVSTAKESPSWLSVSYHGRYGLIDRHGKVIVEPKFKGLSGYDSSRSWYPPEQLRPDYSEGLRPAALNDTWGYIDQHGEFAIPPRWTMAGPFRDGKAQVQDGDVWGIIDKSGEYFVKPQFSYIGRFVEGRARVAVGGRHIELGLPGSKWGFIDDKGQTIVPAIYDYAWDFSQGRALVNVGGRWWGKAGYDFQEGKWGVIDSAGTIVFRPEMEFERPFPLRVSVPERNPVPPIKEDDLRPVKINGKFGFVDGLWRIRIAPQFEVATDFSESLAAVKQNGLFGYLDKTGKLIIKPSYATAGPFSERLAAVTDGKHLTYIDRQNRTIFQVEEAEGKPFSDGVAEIKVNGRWGLIDKTGKLICQPAYLQINRLNDGLWSICDDKEKYGLVDRTGQVLLVPTYDWIGGLQPDGTYWAGYDINSDAHFEVHINRAGKLIEGVELFRFQPRESNGRWGIVDTKSDKFVIDPQFERIYELDQGVLGVIRRNKWGIVDLTTGKWILQPTYYSIERFSEGLAAAGVTMPGSGPNVKGYIDRTGKMVIPPQFNSAGEFQDGIAEVTIYHENPYWLDILYIDKTGQFLWHPKPKKTQ